VTDAQHNPCNPSARVPFWLRYSGGQISVGSGNKPGHNQFMSWVDPKPLSISHFDFGKWNSEISFWNIQWGK
jgi:hypothetical protein